MRKSQAPNPNAHSSPKAPKPKKTQRVEIVAEAQADYHGGQTSDQRQKRRFDLEERTAKFGEEIIRAIRALKQDEINRPLISQVVRSATSIGANYLEADGTMTKKDFCHRIGICIRETKETKHWLRMLATANAAQKPVLRKLWQEAHELNMILAAIANKVRA